MTDHTPGPWSIAANQDDDHLHWVAQGSLGKRIAGVHHNDPTKPDDEALANAILIAASPDMYKALQDVQLGLYELHGSAAIFHPLFDVVDEALERVTKAQMEGG